LPIYGINLSVLREMQCNDSNSEGGVMDKKMIALVTSVASIAIIGYLLYNSFNQLKDIDYNLFDMEEDIDLE
jgi:hypothetical protein